uniref:DNA/RNA-binding protein Alba-like domain-containing protein n=1 Tax=Chlamydomonas euryale TaxID=1486919 RepID=A0A7R9VNS3_9CHLO|mmetsp:Transcript_40836/g.121915  ORF Transcript_40836/g.121915 Transcript_40836/m.121915 type:complete len:141 (+) Transcript_40836:52-474(+)
MALVEMSRPAEAMETAHLGRIQVSSTKHPMFFYVNLAKKLLSEHGEVQLSALGQAITTLVNVAEILRKDQLAVHKRMSTSLDASTDDGRPKPKMEVLLGKSTEFERLMAKEQAERAARQASKAEAALAAADAASEQDTSP